MRLPLLIILLAFFMATNGQRVGVFHSEEMKTMEDAWGRPIKPQTTYQVEGTPFYPDEYTVSKIFFENGKKNFGTKAKLNLYDNKILYQNAKGEEMELVIDVKRIEFLDSLTLVPTIFMKGFSGEGLREHLFYNVLDSGKVVLIKEIQCSYKDFSPYGTGIITRTFTQRPILYLIKEGVVFKLAKNNENIMEILKDEQERIDSYIKANRIKLKSDLNLTAVVQYYNSLF